MACASTGTCRRDGRRRRAELRRLPPDQGRTLSRHPHLRPLRQGPGLPGRLSERLAAHGGEAPGRDGRLQQQVPELGGGRPREVGAARLRLRARRLARLRLLAGLRRSFLAARDQGLLRLHRMGGPAALVERQDRPQRRLLLRHQPVARGLAAAAAPRRHVRLGGRRRLVSRHDAPRRHPLHVLGALVRHAGEDRAVRRGRARQEKPRARRAGVRTGNAVRRAARAKPLRLRRRDPRASPRRRVSQGALAELVQDQGAACSPPPTGAARGCIRAATSRASCAPPPSRSGSRRTGSSTGRTSTPTMAASCSCGSSTTSCTARRTAGTSSRACCCRCATSTRFVERAENEWPLARTRWTKLYLDPAGGTLQEKAPPAAAATSSFEAMGDGVTFLTAPLDAETEITGPSALKLFVSSSTSDADLFVVLRVFSPDLPGGRLPGRHRPAHAHRPGLAAGLASQARQEALAPLSALSHPRPQAAAEAGRGGRARHRDLADLDRRAGGIPHRADDPRQGLRVRRRQRRPAVELQERAQGLRPLPARRSPRSPAGDLRRHDHPALRQGTRALSAAAGRPAEGPGAVATARAAGTMPKSRRRT